MTNDTPVSIPSQSKFQFNWVPELIFHPRRVFEKIALKSSNYWLTPLLILTVTSLVRVIVSGWLKHQAAIAGGTPLPADFQYYTPDQQAQYAQAMQATQSPVFIYVLPAITSILGVWIGWLLVGGILHFVTTILGGRGDTSASMNTVAWAKLPYALRDLVRIAAMLISHKLITSPGLSGFVTAGPGNLSIFLSQLLSLLDVYVIWYIILIILGIRITTGLSKSKAFWIGLLTILILLLIQASIGLAVSKLGSLTVVRPFYF